MLPLACRAQRITRAGGGIGSRRDILVTCPRCDRDTSVVKTVRTNGFVFRERSCECGVTFATRETIVPGATRATAGVYRRKITDEMRAAVMEKSGYKCHYCGTPDGLGIDHVRPLCAPIPAGKTREEETEWRNSVANMVAACARCNSAKGDREVMGGKKLGQAYFKPNNPTPPAAGNGQTAPAGETSFLGGLGGQDLTLRLVPSPPRSERGRARRGRGAALAYTPEFERLLAGCPGWRGNKLPAFNAYVKFNPSVDLVIQKYLLRAETDQWKRGIIPHLSTLLNARFWEKDPQPDEFSARKPEPGAAGWAPATTGKDYLKGAEKFFK